MNRQSSKPTKPKNLPACQMTALELKRLTPAEVKSKINTSMMGVVYLIEFDEDLNGASHYIGWAKNDDCLIRRFDHHGTRAGAKIMLALKEAGIAWRVIQLWQGDRYFERWLKNKKSTPDWCPGCKGKKRVIRKKGAAKRAPLLHVPPPPPPPPAIVSNYDYDLDEIPF